MVSMLTRIFRRFTTAAEAQEGLDSPFSNARIALDERVDGHAHAGEEADGGGALGDAEALVRACLRVDLTRRPSFDRILQSRFLMGRDGWSHEEEDAAVPGGPSPSHMD
jgi:protein-serine/threonine kinase